MRNKYENACNFFYKNCSPVQSRVKHNQNEVIFFAHFNSKTLELRRQSLQDLNNMNTILLALNIQI